MIGEARNSSRRWTTVRGWLQNLEAFARKTAASSISRIAAADDDHALLAAEERGVADGGARTRPRPWSRCTPSLETKSWRADLGFRSRR